MIRLNLEKGSTSKRSKSKMTKKLPKNVTQIDEFTYRITDSSVYMFLLLGKEKALLIDTGMSQGKLGKILPQLTDLPLIVVNTHGHLDHIANNHLFEKVYLNPLDEAIFKQHTDLEYCSSLYYGLLTEMKIPKFIQKSAPVKKYVKKMATVPARDNRVNLPESMHFDLGGRTIELIRTPGHTPGSICLLDVERKILFSGDTICDEGVLLSLPHSTNVHVFLNSVLKLKRLADQGSYGLIYPDHHKVPLELSFLDDYIALCGMLINGEIVGKLVKSAIGDSMLAKYKSIAIAYREGNI